MTETLPAKMTIFEALGAVMDRVRAVGKDSTNTSQNYKFRGIDAVVNAVGPALRENGVIVAPEVLEASYRDVTTSNGKPSREVTVKVRYRFYGPTGDYIDAVTVGEAMDFGDKGTPKAMSVAFRVALLQALCLPTDEPEVDSFSPERGYRDSAPPAPTAEQNSAYLALADRISDAHDEATLRSVWDAIKAGVVSQAITQDQGNQLKTQLNDKKAAVAA